MKTVYLEKYQFEPRSVDESREDILKKQKFPIDKFVEEPSIVEFRYFSLESLRQLVQFDPFANIKGIVWKDFRISKDNWIKLYRLMTILGRQTAEWYGYVHNLINTIIKIARGEFYDDYRACCQQMCFSDILLTDLEKRYVSKRSGNKIYSLAYIILPKRIPLVDKNNLLIGFKFEQCIELIPYFKRNKIKMIDQTRNYIFKTLKGDHDQYECFNPNYVLTHIPLHKRKMAAFTQLSSIVDLIPDKITGQIKCHPMGFQIQELLDGFAYKYKWSEENHRYEYKDEFLNIKDKFKKASDVLVETVSDEKGAEQLLKLIKSIPSLKFKLTIEQEKMISTPNNLLCLGRSGTGKTTSSALRLFSTDVFFKYMEELKRFKEQNPGKLNQDFVINPYFLNNATTLKLVFVTFSPVLTNEVKKFYDETKQHFINELIKRREKKLQMEQQQLQKFEEIKEYENNTLDSISEEFNDTATLDQSQSMKNQDQEVLDTYLQLENELFQDDQDLEKQMKVPFTMDALCSDHFPLFVTVRRLIYMLDASLENSFFSRNNEGQIVGMESGVEWHNENRGVFMINQYYKQQKNYDEQIKKLGTKLMNMDEEFELEEFKEIDDNEDYINIPEQEQTQTSRNDFNVSAGLGKLLNSTQAFVNMNIGRQLSFEVDFETFKTRFWPKVASWTKLTPLVVWTEIYSVIKGGADSNNYQYSNLPFFIYIGQDSRSSKKLDAAKFLKPEERIMIYQIFMHYEKWKQNMGAYDFNDVVNHIITQTRHVGLKPSQMIHFLMVDEVQDLTPNILCLLTNITEKNIFFCGDTAQTIAKGVGFRFYDLKTIFKNNEYFSAPSVLQLAKNFRSHSKILDLANSVVSLIELLFPKTIDKLLKESSDLEGPRPIFIDSVSNNQQLYKLLLGKSLSNLKNNNMQDQDMNKPQFGCNQVIIVRDQESKLRIPEFLQNMLCLTVYEAKGLEFDDVILFNFFEDSKCGNQWMLMKDISFERKIKKRYKDFDFINFESLDIQEFETNYEESKIQKGEIVTTAVNDDEEIDTTLYLSRDRGVVYRQFAQLCTELKFLYVAITRPKKTLIVYDENSKLRRPLQDFWNEQQLIHFINREMLDDHSLIPMEVQDTLQNQLGDKQASEEEWRHQGIMLFKKKFYNSAIQCFRNSNDDKLVLRCQAYQHADKAQYLLGESESKIVQSKNKVYKKSERNQMKKEAKTLKQEAFDQLELAGSFFEKIGMNRHAAQCFCSAMKLERAATMFESLVDYGQSAECYLKTKNYRKAAEYYAKAGLFANAFECYERLEDWEGLLMCLSNNKMFFKKEERESLIEKYFPIALNQLYHMYSQLDPSLKALGAMNEENRGRFQEMKIKLKFQKSISVIKEDDNEDEEEDDDDDEEEESSNQDSAVNTDQRQSEAQNSNNDTEERKQEVENKNNDKIDSDKKIIPKEYSLNDDNQTISIIQESDESDNDNQDHFKTKKMIDKDGQSFEMIDTSTGKNNIDEIQQKTKKKQFNQYDYQDDDLITSQKKKKKQIDEEEEDEIELIENDLIHDQLLEQEQQDQTTNNENINKQATAMNQSDQFEILSSLDPDDEFLQSGRSMSLIESVVSRTSNSFSIISGQSSEFSIVNNSKLHSIIQSVYSFAENQSVASKVSLINESIQSQQDNTLDLAQNFLDISQTSSAVSLLNSSKFSTIQNERDQYAEDIVMQKIIFYVSLFSDDVKSRLNEMRSKDKLAHLDIKYDDQNNMGFDNQFMFIDLDDISQELLYLILDTLEHYELFRLCLIICNRYQLKDQIARYLVSIGNKYSNLKNFRFNFLPKIAKFNDIQAQQTYSIIAHEAMHNVLQLVEKDYLKIDEQGRDTINLRENCFDQLFLQGFWRKLVFLMDVDSSLQLCKAMNDKESFKLLYLVYKCGIKDGQHIREIMQDTNNEEFITLIKKDITKQTKLLAQEIAMSDLIANMESAIKQSLTKDSKILENITPQIKKQNQDLIFKLRKLVSVQVREELSKKKIDFFEVKKAIAIVCSLAQIHSISHVSSNYFLYNLNRKDYKTIIDLIARVLKMINNDKLDLATDKYQEKQSKNEIDIKMKDEVLRVCMMPFGVFMLDGLDLFSKFNSQFCIIKRDSSIIKQIFDKHQESRQDFNNNMLLKLSQTQQVQFNQASVLQAVVKQQFDRQQKHLDSNIDINKCDLAIPCDLSGLDYFLVPKQWAIDIVSTRISEFGKYTYLRDSEEFHTFEQRIIKYTTLQNLYRANSQFANKILQQKSNFENNKAKLKGQINKNVAFMIQKSTFDQIPSVVEGVVNSYKTQLLKAKLQIKEKIKNSMAKDYSITNRPKNRILKLNELPKIDANERDTKHVALNLAFALSRDAFKIISKKEDFYKNILSSFRLFAIADEYIFMIEILRSRKKQIMKTLKQQTNQLKNSKEVIKKNPQVQLINNTYNLLDAHVYIKNNLWIQSADCIYLFLQTAFDFISFKEIISLLEGAFYRTLFCNYIYAKSSKDGVLIPDYAMVHIEPNSNYQCTLRKNNNFEVIKKEYFQVEIERPKSSKQIEKAFYWMEIFLQVLNTDMEAIIYDKIYYRIYNMMITFLINTTSPELHNNMDLALQVEKVANKFLNSPLENQFGYCKQFLDLIPLSIHKYQNNIKSRGVLKLHSQLMFKKEKGVQQTGGGFVNLSSVWEYNKETQSELLIQMDKAYYVEMNQLAKHYAAANYICRVWRKIKQQRQEQNQSLKISSKELSALSNQKYCLQIYNSVINQRKVPGHLYQSVMTSCQILGKAIENVEIQIRQLYYTSISKLVCNSLDLHYLRDKINQAFERKTELMRNAKTILIKSKNIESLCKDLIELAQTDIMETEAQENQFNEWVSKKAEPNIIELEKKQLNIRNKWETLVSFQKRRKVMLRHLSRQKK